MQAGLLQLHESIRLGFDGKMVDVPREEFRRRVIRANRPDYIPINFFLFNKIRNGIDMLVADELVFQALNSHHSSRFDKLALFAFNFSYTGTWRGAAPYQRRPALWAFHYLRDRVAAQFNWDTRRVNADDIEKFVQGDPRYHAQTARKLATNLNYLYQIGRLSELTTERVERWWVDSLFLALDRLVEDRKISGLNPGEEQYASLLSQSGFRSISGKAGLEKDLAARHLLTLYIACGGRDRFTEEGVRKQLELRDVAWLIANDDDNRPKGAVHPTNPRILKNIPKACAMLATYAGFDIIDADELEHFDTEEFIRRHTRDALQKLRENNIRPIMTAEELEKITRER